jgi:3-hydroxybutyryl-CoA dehydratase
MTDSLHGLYLEDLSEGQSESLSKVITAQDVEAFAEISGDTNPVHLNEDYAKGTMFGGRIAHGILTAGLISAVLGTKLPGPGAIYLSQSLKFRAPVKLGDLVEAKVVVTAIDQEKRRVTLNTSCSIADKVVLEGEAVVMVDRKAAAAAAA